MDWNNPILYLAFIAQYLMLQHHRLQPPTPLIEDTKREFTPMTISPGQSIETSPADFAQTFDTYELLLSVRDVLNILWFDLDGEVVDTDEMQDDLVEIEQAQK